MQKMFLGQGRFQDFFQGVAEISSGGYENLPGGGETKCAIPSSPLRFSFLTQRLNAQLIQTHCYKKEPKGLVSYR